MSPSGVETITLDEALASMGDSNLLKMFAREKANLERKQRFVGRCEQEIYRRMDERGAKAIPDEAFTCEMVQEMVYDQASFTPLLEVFNPADLATCFTPEHIRSVSIAAKWTTVKVLALARRYGDTTLAIVEKARQPGRRSLKFNRR